MAKKQKTVKVYTTAVCPWCVKVKEYLKSKNIEYKEFNVGTDMAARQEMFLKTGQGGVPVVEIEDTIIIGFDKESIDEALGL
ncbi:glutathione S-transferase N-terminal domain-containing protein [Candidatus Woesearchaeota archaeon]|nr:glutathione S-transferase N-terminal domain-containing protein [Candidatus Woesearchaeota archaeon]